MRLIALIAALCWPLGAFGESGEVCLEDPFELTTTPSTGTPSGTPLCYDTPANTVCHYESGGSMFGESNSMTYSWDGTTFGINKLELDNAGLIWELQTQTGVGSLNMIQAGTARWRFFLDDISHFAPNGPQISREDGNINAAVFQPDRADPDTGVSGDGADTLGFLAGGSLATWDGTSFDLPSSGLATNLVLDSGVSDSGLGYSGGTIRFFLSGVQRGALSTGQFFVGTTIDRPSIQNEPATITNPTFAPHRGSLGAGLAGDGSGNIGLNGGIVFPTSAAQSLLAGDAIAPDSGSVAVVGNGGAVTLTSNPQITDGADGGHILCIEGTSDTNTVELVDGNGLRMAGDQSMTLADGDTWCGLYSDTATDWLEISRSDN